jgi:hypothetical protein
MEALNHGGYCPNAGRLHILRLLVHCVRVFVFVLTGFFILLAVSLTMHRLIFFTGGAWWGIPDTAQRKRLTASE